MKIQMQEGESAADLTCGGWDIAITGRILDDRGRAAVDFLTQCTNRSLHMEYDSETFKLDINAATLNADDLESHFAALQGESIVLEATTLGFAEIFLCCRSLRALGFSSIDFLYVEPKRYSLRDGMPRKSRLLNKRDFDLSGEVPGYRAIPGAMLMLSDRLPQRGVFMLGYEERRLDRALEDFPIQPSLCTVVFGVPAFKPGWEMDAFANNIRVIKERNLRGGVHFCGAENPAAAFDILTQLHSALGPNERLFVAPLGTKPNGIAVALFASCYQGVGILYDHPKRLTRRSEELGRWHLFSADL